ncbi:MAG TPA: SpoIIE family protein phosphatase [Pirellulales bacterium]|nr:SpoIIE family protein phosphatase [Pirellulales bacterium]
MALLQSLNGLNPGQQYPLSGQRAVMGRHPDCDIVLDVGAVSRQHAQILIVNDEFFVEDLESRNGTFVNGQLVRGRQLLRDNDRVKICDLLFSFHHGTPPANGGDDGDRRPPSSSCSSVALVMDEGDGPSSNSTIMSTLDVRSSRGGTARETTVNPELKLRALLEISRNLSSTLTLDEVLPKILDSLFKIFLQADRGFVLLQEREGAPLIPKAVKHRRPGHEDTIRASRTIVNQAMTVKEAILSADAASDSRFDSSQSIADFRIRSMMCAPLVHSAGHALGVIQIDTLDQRTPFHQDDLDVLASVASQAVFAVENAQLHESALKRQALERDLELAHKVQQGFLPSAPPSLEGYEFFDFYEPANQVGGDYFDYVPLPGRRLAMIVADVSGKGMPAALLMAKLSAETRFTLVIEPDPAAVMNRLNAGFCGAGWEDRFVTMCLSVVDLATHEVRLVNAGHMPPFLRRANRLVEPVGADEAGIPLGVSADFEYTPYTLKLVPGESLALFTDGFSEAMNMENELYGLVRIEEQLRGEARGVRQLGERLLADVKRFVGKRSQADDMCLLCFGRNP